MADNRCENCMELQRSLVRTLGEKRSLLLRLQKEQARTRKLLKEAEKARKRDGEVCGLILYDYRGFEIMAKKKLTDIKLLRNSTFRNRFLTGISPSSSYKKHFTVI